VADGSSLRPMALENASNVANQDKKPDNVELLKAQNKKLSCFSLGNRLILVFKGFKVNHLLYSYYNLLRYFLS